MRKFTIFTVILTVIILVVVAELVVTEYLPKFRKDIPTTEVSSLALPEDLDLSKVIETNILGADIDYSKIPAEEGEQLVEEKINLSDSFDEDNIDNDSFGTVFENEPNFDTNIPLLIPDDEFLIIPDDNSSFPEIEGSGSVPVYQANASEPGDFEDNGYTSLNQSALIREDMIASAGFVGANLEQEPHNGFLYKTIYIDDLNDINMDKYVVKKEDSMLLKVYVFNIGALNSVSEVYELMKLRGSEGFDIEIVETSEYGDAAFYMNDAKRSGVAFLTVRFGGLIYGFSYPKNYHPQVKNLITLIDMEF